MAIRKWLLNTSDHDADKVDVDSLALSHLMHSIAAAVREYGTSTGDCRGTAAATPHGLMSVAVARSSSLRFLPGVRRRARRRGLSDDEDDEL